MLRRSASVLPAAALASGVALAVLDLTRTDTRSLVVYTTPALRDLLEEDLLPRFRERTGKSCVPVYVPAGQQYNRLRVSGGHPEADVFIHASPLYLEKGFDEGHFEPYELACDAAIAERFRSRRVAGGRIWYAFAWSPLVCVHAPGSAPDLARSDLRFGLAHPLLSNNGIYTVLLLEQAKPEAGALALGNTTVQPVNARASVNGIADGSFDVTLGYEAVTLDFEKKGARVAHDLPLLGGERVTVPVLLSVGIVRGGAHEGAGELARFLLEESVQRRLPEYGYRPAAADVELPGSFVPLASARTIDPDWESWREIEAALPRYEVRR
ncbi:substrate-binding domain-containing protein [bacterium]|nr:substrate-binding domain-containing protein [bacterium]